MRHLTFILILLALSLSAHAERPCTQPDLHAPAARALALQSQLLAIKVGYNGMDESVPAPVQSQMAALKDALATLATLSLACAPDNASPAALQSALSTALGLDKPQPPTGNAASDQPQIDHLFGADLAVKVTRPTARPILLFEFHIGIPCGFDSELLAFEYRHVHWMPAVRWQSPRYDSISGAFGDFFDYQILQPEAATPPKIAPHAPVVRIVSPPAPWFLAVAHGHPWCTSNMSAFDVDVIQSSEFEFPQHPVYHEGATYSRTDDPVFKNEPDGFELRMTAYSLDGSIIFRPVIYRYRVTAGSPTVSPVARVQPIAMNGRDFVDEWLQAPWGEAKNWAAPDSLPSLEAVHKKIEAQRDPQKKDWPVFSYGPVRACADAPSHFQVEIDAAPANATNPRQAPPTFFQINQQSNGFTLLSASTLRDPNCTGADIMTAGQGTSK